MHACHGHRPSPVPLSGTVVPEQADCNDINTTAEQTKPVEVKTITFLSLNVSGFRNKLLLPEFVENILKYDILCLSETKLDESDNISNLLHGYTLYLNNRRNKVALHQIK